MVVAQVDHGLEENESLIQDIRSNCVAKTRFVLVRPHDVSNFKATRMTEAQPLGEDAEEFERMLEKNFKKYHRLFAGKIGGGIEFVHEQLEFPDGEKPTLRRAGVLSLESGAFTGLVTGIATTLYFVGKSYLHHIHVPSAHLQQLANKIEFIADAVNSFPAVISAGTAVAVSTALAVAVHEIARSRKLVDKNVAVGSVRSGDPKLTRELEKRKRPADATNHLDLIIHAGSHRQAPAGR